MKTLLVEDEETTRDMLKDLLQSLGLDCDAFATAEEGWKAYQVGQYELALLDWILPGMDGLELSRLIRQSSMGRHTVILVITGHKAAEDLRAVLAAGADDYLSKPLDIGLLQVRLTVAQNRVRQLAELNAAQDALEDAQEDLEMRVKQRTAELAIANDTLRLEIAERERVEAALREREVRERAILTHALDGVITMDATGRIVEFNPAAEGIFGHKRVAVLGRDMIETLIPERLRQEMRSGLERQRSSGEDGLVGRRVEVPALRADGTEVLAELSIVLIGLDGGTLFTAFVRDITRRRQAEMERERLIKEREDALTKVKMLSGMLPMCASCKKIRDEGGIWHELEHYLQQHSAASVTHGLCPNCAHQLYPHVFPKQA